MSAVDYGYDDAAPDTAKYGYGDAAPDNTDYGYGNAAPDSSTDYGYGDAAPDSSKLGHGAAEDATKYGYGDPSPGEAAKYGYGDQNGVAKLDHGLEKIRAGLNDTSGSRRSRRHTITNSPGGGGGGGRTRRKGRYRRRGSVTKYSLSTAETVKNEYHDHEEMINKFRNQTLLSSNSDHSVPLHLPISTESGDEFASGDDLERKKKNKKGFMKFSR